MNAIRIKLTDELLQHVIADVASRTGNVVGPKQVNMIESRLSKRAMELNLKDEKEYLAHFQQNKVAELEYLVSVLTVHHSFFFREFGQFEFLGQTVLPALVSRLTNEGKKKIRIWSAACSRGQEAYSLFMFVDSYLKEHGHKFEIEILGTDVDVESVKIASNGVYAWDEIKEIPMGFLSNYWVRGSGEIEKFAKIKDAARKACTFKPANLMETNKFSVFGQFDVIFCRNVFIYFQADDITRISAALTKQLSTDGYFFVGLSESLTGPPSQLKKRGPSIYGPATSEIAAAAPAKTAVHAIPTPIRVICVDDSKTILSIMKSILKSEHGFEIVGTAVDGLEAAKLVQSGIKFDVMTLDVHMPNMTGTEYLAKYFTAQHPPVVMLTSASRDNMDLAHEAMKLGAKDYIEKPSLNDLANKSDEIRAKLRMLTRSKVSASTKASPATSFEKQFQTSMAVRRTQDKVNVVFSDESKYADLISLIRDNTFTKVPCVVVLLGEAARLARIKERIAGDLVLKGKITPLGSDPLLEGKVYFIEIANFRKETLHLLSSKSICYSVISNISRSQWETCHKSSQMKILIAEDVDRSVFLAHTPSVYVSPATSFAYMANEFFGKLDLKIAG